MLALASATGLSRRPVGREWQGSGASWTAGRSGQLMHTRAEGGCAPGGRRFVLETLVLFTSVLAPPVCAQSLRHARLCVDSPWTAACPAPLSMGFSRQGCCSELPFLPPEDLPD